MTDYVKVKFPKSDKGWALLAPSDLSTPKPDGTMWELYIEESPAVQPKMESTPPVAVDEDAEQFSEKKPRDKRGTKRGA